MSRDPEPRLVYAPDQPPQPWRNGGGQTRELSLWPAGPDAWQVRISVARIDRSGAFSPFSGVERWFSVLDGAGVVLRIGSRVLKLDPQTAPICFDGGTPPECSLVDGATNDLNLMCRGGHGRLLLAVSGLVWQSSAPQRGLFTRVPGIWRDASDRLVELSADTLLWTTASEGPMVFEARSAAKAPVGYWLAYDPDRP